MVKRYVMPCFNTDRHGLSENPEGYIVQYDDYNSLEREKVNLEEKYILLQKQLDELQKKYQDLQTQKAPSETSKPKKKKGGWSVKVPIDEEEWIYLTDLKTEEKMIFDTKEEAEKYGTLQGVHQIEKVK